jgi:hypothetical protein
MRYVTIAIIAALMMAASASVYPHSSDRFEREVSIEVVSESGGIFLPIPHRNFWQGGPISSSNILRRNKARTTASSYTI